MGWRGSQGLQWICKLFRVVLGAWRQEERRGQKTHGWNGQVLLLWLWMPTTNSTWGRKSHHGESHEFVWPHWTLSPCGPSMDGVSQIWVIRTHWKSDHVAEKCIFPQKSGRLLSHWKSPNVWTCVELALLGSNSPMEVLSAVFTYILFSSIFFFLFWIKN